VRLRRASKGCVLGNRVTAIAPRKSQPLERIRFILAADLRFGRKLRVRLANVDPPPGHGTECVGRVRGRALATRKPGSNEARDHDGGESLAVLDERDRYLSHRRRDLRDVDKVILDCIQHERGLWPHVLRGRPSQRQGGVGLCWRVVLDDPISRRSQMQGFALTEVLPPIHLPSSLNTQNAAIQPVR
jgi:hypothetical protein